MSGIPEKNLKINIGRVIKLKRKERGMTQEELAFALKVEPRTLSRVETGATFISASLLVKLSEFFEVEPKKFFEFDLVQKCSTDRDKIHSIIEMLESSDSSTIDTLYKITKSLAH